MDNEKRMARIVTDSTNLKKGWVYPMVRVDTETFMLDCPSVAIHAHVNDLLAVDMPYQSILGQYQ